MLVFLITGFVQNKITPIFKTTLYMIPPKMLKQFFILLVSVVLVYLLSNKLIITHSYILVAVICEYNIDYWNYDKLLRCVINELMKESFHVIWHSWGASYRRVSTCSLECDSFFLVRTSLARQRYANVADCLLFRLSFKAFSTSDGKELIWKELNVSRWTQSNRYCFMNALKMVEEFQPVE